MKQFSYIVLFILILILSSCRTQVVEYPQFFFSGQIIQKDKDVKIPEIELNDICDNKLKRTIYSIVESSSSDCFIIRLSQNKDTLHLTLHDVELSSALKLSSNNVGVFIYQKESNNPKYIFLPINTGISHMVDKTKKNYVFKPQLIRLSKDRYIGYYDRTTYLDGYIFGNKLFINQFILDNEKNNKDFLNNIWETVLDEW